MMYHSLSSLPLPALLALAALLSATGCRAEGGSIGPDVARLYSLVENGDFEAGEDVPDWWARHPPQPETWGSHRRDTRERHSGRASGLLVSEGPHPAGKASVQWMRYNMPVEGGGSLLISAWVKTEGVAFSGIGCHFYDAQGAHLGFERVGALAKADDWTCIDEEVRVPAEAVKMGFALYGADNGKTWYDDVALLRTPRAEAGRGTPVLDGKPDEACWRPLGPFALHSGERLAGPQPAAWVAYDDQCLYVAVRSATTPRATVELRLAPHHRSRAFYRIGIRTDGRVVALHSEDPAWRGAPRIALGRAGGGWSAEMAIPFADLKLDTEVGSTWGMSVVLPGATPEDEAAVWSLGWEKGPARYGRVALAPDLSPLLRTQVERRLVDLEALRQSLTREVRAAGLSTSLSAGPLKRLGGIGAEIARTRAAPRLAPWPKPMEDLVRLRTDLNAARDAAVAVYFAPDPSGQTFRVAVAHSLQKVPRTEPVPAGIFARDVRLDAARDESESFQLVVVPAGKELRGVQVEAPPLVGKGGRIPLVWHRVGYVETQPPGYSTTYVGWWPDPLLPAAPFDVAAGERQPIWLTANVPPDAAPGDYSGKVTVRCEGHSVSVPVALRVRSFRLPRPGTLATPFGNYANVLAKWWWKGPYQKEMPIEVYARWSRFMGEYRLAPKNIGREYISQTEENGEIRVDLSALKQTVAPLAARYFPDYSFCFHRTPVGNSIGKVPAGTDPQFAAKVVKAYADEWKRQGLPEKVFLYGYDEPKPEHYPFLRQAYQAIRQAAPGYPIVQTIGDPNPEALVGLVDIWCPLTPAAASAFYQARRKAGDTLWTYVCCSPKPPHANFFVDEPATDHRVLFWQVRQIGATGLLYWCLCWWDGLPNAASGQPCFPDVPIRFKDLGTYHDFKDNGDGLLVYPGKEHEPLPSIRLEVIRDGIEDYEYLALLSRLVARARALPAGRRPSAAALRRAEELCTVPQAISQSMTLYTRDPQLLLERRRQVADEIEELERAVR